MRDPQFGRAARRLGRRALACIFAVLTLGTIDGSAWAAALQVSPIRLDLSVDKPAAALTLHNDGSVPLNAQVRVFAWTQSLDEDHLERTSEIVASPPIVRIAPNGDQTIRILRVSHAPLAREETYRLLIDEIPNGQSATATGVRMQLRYSVPVFAGVSDERAPPLALTLERKDAQAGAPLMLRAANNTDLHAQLSRVRLEWPDGQSTQLSAGLLGYALPRAVRRWPVAGAPANVTSATVHALVNGEPVTTRVNIAEPASGSASAPPPGR
ncbi:fimbrial biogenesis chaperone [Caballeronia insecticola]|uniref:Chaperone protein EcpD n=1 Tax=Caballeronia insecticola TaxID=758793 RepID=R4X3A9_9BURK|nr:molecular chaperone [Caballeronia insecticola]BAN27256.1 chaperone protein EcpD [Caballeronia insecticola]